MSNTIKIYCDSCDWTLICGDYSLQTYSTREAAEILHDIARGSHAYQYFLGLSDTTRRDAEELEELIKYSALVAEFGCRADMPCSTFDELFSYIWQQLSVLPSAYEQECRKLLFWLTYEDTPEAEVEHMSSSWVSWLVNADASGMTEEEFEQVRTWEQEYEYIDCLDLEWADSQVLAIFRKR